MAAFLMTALSLLGRFGRAALAPIVRPILLYVLVAILGALVANYTPVFGHAAQLRAERQVSKVWKNKAGEAGKLAETNRSGWSACEVSRRVEVERSRLSASEASVQCELSIQAARRSAVKIEGLINETPPPDAAGCRARALIDPDGLRSALAGD